MNPLNKRSSMTVDQARATDPLLTAWVAASAGTGKTHVLTARVLRLLLNGTPPENIVCLTFTKAAAAEMKNRIFAELGRWSTMDDTTLVSEIAVRTEEQADDDMLQLARQLFARVLDLSGGLQIQTFHSFCQALLGRFPLEAGMVPGFEGVDETEAASLMAFAKDQMLEQTRDPSALGLRGALDHVAGLVTERTFDEVIDRLSFEAPMLSRASLAFNGTEGLINAVFSRMGVERHARESDIIETSFASSAFDQTGCTLLAQALPNGSAQDQKRGRAISELLAAPKEKWVEHYSVYKTAFLTKTGTPIVKVATKKVLESNPDLEDIIVAEQQRLLDIEDHCVRLRAAQATGALLRLGLTQIDQYRRAKSERGQVDFDDLIERTVSLFAGADVAPWILYKLDNRIDHILVDEAQDTNRDQWRVVETLAAEFFAGEGARDITRTIFAVGDAKQSIFSFQRADPKEFIAARNRIFERAQNAAQQADAVPLSQSFRSGEAVLSLVDAVFAQGGRAVVGLTADDEAVSHRFVRQGHAGHVELWPLEAPERQKEEEDGAWQPPIVQETVHSAERRAAWRVARHIHQSIGTRSLKSKARSVRAGDILVLVRRRTAFVDQLVRALKSLGVPVAGRDRMMLLDELPVMDLMALMRFAVQPTDDLTLATVLKGPLVGLSETALFELAHDRSGTLWDALYKARHKPDYFRSYDRLVNILNRTDIEGPFAFLNYLLVELGGRERFAARLGDEVHDPIDEMLDAALGFELSRPASLLGFVEHLANQETQIKRDMEQAGDTVRILTSHSAKGLQAPVVYLSDLVGLPDLTKDTRLLSLPSQHSGEPDIPIWASTAKGVSDVEAAKLDVRARQLSEYKRLLYVALTRAEDELYVAGWRGPREPDPECWYSLISEGFDRLSAKDIRLSDGREVRRFEIEQTAEIKAPETKVIEVENTSPFPDWLRQTMPDEPDPPRPLAPSRPDEEPAVAGPLMRAGSNKFLRGTLLHSLLQWLPELEPEQREHAAKRYLKNASQFEPGQIDGFWQEVRRVLDHPELSPLFGPGSRAEVSVAGMVQTPGTPKGRPISGQVDRLVVLDDRVLLVDYKSNRPPPVDVSGVSDVYLRQMALYQRALGQVYPDKEIQTALLWTDGARLMQLPQSLLDDALQRSGV
jgi:ATP-dependent helicase/nuclease subunit A